MSPVPARPLDLDLDRLFAYEFWANRETLQSLERARDSAPRRALEIMAHVAAASRLWFARLTREKIKVEVWPKRTIAQIREDLDALEAMWSGWLGASPQPSLDESISYVNSKGEPWSSTPRDILTHLALHSAYHRGQIAMLLGQSGQGAAYTDFIHAARQGLL